MISLPSLSSPIICSSLRSLVFDGSQNDPNRFHFLRRTGHVPMNTRIIYIAVGADRSASDPSKYCLVDEIALNLFEKRSSNSDGMTSTWLRRTRKIIFQHEIPADALCHSELFAHPEFPGVQRCETEHHWSVILYCFVDSIVERICFCSSRIAYG